MTLNRFLRLNGAVIKYLLFFLTLTIQAEVRAEEQFILMDVKKIDDIFHYSVLSNDGTQHELRQRNLDGVVDLVTQHTNDEDHGHGDDYAMWRNYLSKPHPTVGTLRTYFLQASYEFKVPVQILEAIGQVESNWTQIGPSIDRGWGIMHLVQNEYADTLGEAARLLGMDQQTLRDDAQQNIRGAAALIGYYAGESRESFTKMEDWFGALAQFTGLIDDDLRKMQASNYYKKMQSGGVSSTLWGEQIVLDPNSAVEIPYVVRSSQRRSSVDYPSAIPSFTDYNYTPSSGRSINMWVNHWIGTGTVAGALSRFKSNSGGASAHFIVSKEGDIYQVVSVGDIAWHAGVWAYNSISIGVEHDVTIGGSANWNTVWTEPLLRASAKMAKYFIDLYGIPQSHPEQASLAGGIFGHLQIKKTACPGTFPWSTWMSYLSSASNAITYFDGAGSLISPTQDGSGANSDVDRMHANPSRTSTVVFQFLNNSAGNCHHVDISSSIGEAVIQAKSWDSHEVTTSYRGSLPMSVNSEGSWTVVAVTSTAPLADSANVYATCKTSSDSLTPSYYNRTVMDLKLIPLDLDYYWTGTGSIMSHLGSGTGKTADVVPTFESHKSLSSFQWYASSSCSKLNIFAGGAVSLNGDNEVAIKRWNADSNGWSGNLCSSLPCTVSPPNDSSGYFIVKVKTNAGAVPSGYLNAKCTN